MTDEDTCKTNAAKRAAEEIANYRLANLRGLCTDAARSRRERQLWPIIDAGGLSEVEADYIIDDIMNRALER
jgi:hypothetical protein